MQQFISQEEAVKRQHQHSKHSDSLAWLINKFKVERAAEIGVYGARTSALVLKSCPTLKYYLMVDPWKSYAIKGATGEADGGYIEGAEWEKMYAYAKSLETLYPNVAFAQRSTSLDAAHTIADGSLDLVFIDGDHSYLHCDQDIDAWLPKVRKGGILAGHDYYSRWPGVLRAVDEHFNPEQLNYLPDTAWFVKL